MLDTIFLQIFDMTKVAGIVILIVLLVRLCLKKAPKVFSYALWAVVLFRLLCPFSMEAPVSLIPQTEPTIETYDLLNEPVTPLAAMDAAQQAVGDALNGGIGIQHVRTTGVDEDGTARVISTDWRNVWILFLKYVWLAGIAVMLVYSGVTYGKLRRKLLASIRVRDNIYIADHIDSPFVMGLIRPKIYLPSSLSEKERDYIILHEQHHIRRGDHIVKLLSFAALCLHCFNPLVWIAFILSGKDMEMSCDEAVLRKLGEDIRVDYSASLISLATGRRIIAGTPLAFGEGNTEGRIRNIAKWRKPAVWVIVVAVVVCVAAAVCLITNPMNRDTQLWGAEYRVEEILYRTSEEYDYADNDSPSICITADYCFYTLGSDGEWHFVGQMEPYTLDKDELADYTAYDDGWLRHYNPGEITDSYIMRMNETEYEAQLYLAFKTKKGDTLLGIGVEDLSERGQGASDDTALEFLLRLESTFESIGQAGTFLDRSLAQTVGGDVDSFYTWTNANKPGYIIIGFESDDSEYADGWQVPSPEKTDMGFAVFYHNKDESGYRLIQCHVYEDAALAENGIYLCPDPAVLNLSGELIPKQTYDVILVNNDAVARAERIWEYADGTEKKQSDSYLNGHQMLLYSWENDRAQCTVRQYYYDAEGHIIDETPVQTRRSGEDSLAEIDTFGEVLTFMTGGSETEVTGISLDISSAVRAADPMPVSREAAASLVTLLENMPFTFASYEPLHQYGGSSYTVHHTLADGETVTLYMRGTSEVISLTREEFWDDQKRHYVSYHIVPEDPDGAQKYLAAVQKIWYDTYHIPAGETRTAADLLGNGILSARQIILRCDFNDDADTEIRLYVNTADHPELFSALAGLALEEADPATDTAENTGSVSVSFHVGEEDYRFGTHILYDGYSISGNHVGGICPDGSVTYRTAGNAPDGRSFYVWLENWIRDHREDEGVKIVRWTEE